MIRWPLTVNYRDGTSAEVVADQYAIGMYLRWSVKNGLPAIDFQNVGNPVELIVPLRVFAWAELQRDAAKKVGFDTWDATVAEVEMRGSGAAADPILTAVSGG